MRPELKCQYFCRVSVTPINYRSLPSFLLLYLPIHLLMTCFSLFYLSLSLSRCLSLLFRCFRCRRCCVLPDELSVSTCMIPIIIFYGHASKTRQACNVHPSPILLPQRFLLFATPLDPNRTNDCQCVKMLAPASNRHAAKVSNDTGLMRTRDEAGGK